MLSVASLSHSNLRLQGCEVGVTGNIQEVVECLWSAAAQTYSSW